MEGFASLTFWDLHQWPIGIVVLVTSVLYEHLITFDKEVKHFWNQSFNLGTTLFFANRYFLWVVVALQAILVFGHLPLERCPPFFGAVTWGIFVGTVISCSILTLRTVALWDGNQKIKAIFWFLIPATIIPSLVSAIQTRASLKFTPHATASKMNSCMSILDKAENNIFFMYIMVTVYEFAIFILTLIRSIRHLRQKHGHWVTIVYAQGLGFCMIVLLFSTANMLLWRFGPVLYHGWLATIQYAASSICSTRVLLSLREQREMEHSTKLEPPSGDSESQLWTTVIYRQAGQESFWDELDTDHR